MLKVENLSVRYGKLTIVDNLSFSVDQGQWLMIVGPNGAGKSTALNAITQSSAYEGKVLFEGTDISRMKASVRAQHIGVLAQSHFVGYSFSVEEVVRLGRYCRRRGVFAGKNGDDDAAVEEALMLTGMDKQRKQSVLTLSGGELQRTFLAQVLAQQPRLLLLDEPTNHLDLVYQKQIFSLISKWLETPERAVISVVHDLSLAKVFGSDALLMNHGRCVAYGHVKDVLCRENLDPIYDMDVAAWMKMILSAWQQ